MNNNLSENAKYIVMIGPDYKSRGGIASVIATYFDFGMMAKWPIIFLPTHIEAGKWRKLLHAIFSLFGFIKLLSLRKVGILHVHVARRNSFWRKSIFMQCAFFFGCPVLIHLHSGGFPAFYEQECGVIKKYLIRYFLHNASALIVLTDSWRDAYTKFEPKNIVVIPNFVEITPSLNRDYDTPVGLLFLGRLTKEKGLFDLIPAVAGLIKTYPDLIVKLGGEGNLEEVINILERLGIRKNFIMEGWVEGDKKRELLSENNIFVLPSYVEGLPMGVLEAMSVGLPVVATSVGGVPDIIVDGENGLLIEVGNQQALENQLYQLLASVEMRERLAVSAKKCVEQRYSANAVIPKLESLYMQFGIKPKIC